jgi:hypothetical protein
MRKLASLGAVLATAVIFVPTAPAGGTFHASDPGLDAIWETSVRTAADMLAPGPLRTDWDGNPCSIELKTVILDGVVRDRCPYIGDEAVIDATYDASVPHLAVQRSMLRWFADHQHRNGAIPSSPLNGGSLVLFDYNGYWLQTLYRYALYSGDLGLVRKVWPNVKRLIAWYQARPRSSGLLVNDNGNKDYAFIHRHGSVVAYYNAQYVLVLREAARLAGWIGATAERTLWNERSKALSDSFERAFWDAANGAFLDTTSDPTTHPQDANAFAILSGIATPSQGVSALAYLTNHNQRDYGNTIVDTQTWDNRSWGYQANERVYPFMSYFELLARFRLDLDASAIYLIRREWGYMTRNGPGSMWETIGPSGGGPTDQYQSWDAGWSSGAAPALTEYVLGVRPTSPGFATFTVDPHPADLGWANGTVETPHGPLAVSWTLVGGKPHVTARAPKGTRWVSSSRG